MKAVLYESNTGFTKKYAVMASEKWHVPCYSLSEAKKSLEKGTDIVFFGWICARKIQGYKKAKNRYHLEAIVAVGMNFPDEETKKQLAEDNHITATPFFLLQGGIAPNQLSSLHKRIINFVATALEKAGAKKEEDQILVHAMRNGKSFVTKENLQQIFEWSSKTKNIQNK